MNTKELKNAVEKVNAWKSGDQRAPHRPLLILLGLGELQKGNTKISYEAVEDQFRTLLDDFGPPRKVIHPEYPFVRLANDQIWELKNFELDTKSNVSAAKLRREHAIGGFKEEVVDALQKDPQLIKNIAKQILETNFPETLHDDVAIAVGLNLGGDKKKVRDPKFRDEILKAYNYSCSVCGFGVRLGNSLVGLEAAHIKWHQAGGPDEIQNGIALCSLHHKLFDVGAFTIDLKDQIRMLVSDKANGLKVDDVLLKFHGKSLIAPIGRNYYPEGAYLSWHVKEVFKGQYRPI